MEAAQFEKFLKDQYDEEDDLDIVISNHIRLLGEFPREDDEIHAILQRKHGGSRIGRSPNLRGEHVEGHARIMRDYFCDNPQYPAHLFRRRFRMRKPLFMKIHDDLLHHCKYFQQRPDAVGNPGLSSTQKMTAALWMFAYGVAGDAIDEYVQIGESTAIANFKEFAAAIVEIYEAEYLRAPTEADVKRHMDINTLTGFPGMFGSLDCTHWIPEKCPYSLRGQYRDKDGENSIIPEAIATYNLWIWHAFIGIPGSNNDVIDRSPLLVNLLIGVAPKVNFDVNGHRHNMFYLLTDGIYPNYTIFVKTINNPEGAKRKYFSKRQEAITKDVERCFGVLQARFAMVRNPARWWSEKQMITVWRAAIILHNMIIHDEEGHEELNQDYLFEIPAAVHSNRGRPQEPLNFRRLTNAVDRVKSKAIVNLPQEDLISHLRDMRGMQAED